MVRLRDEISWPDGAEKASIKFHRRGQMSINFVSRSLKKNAVGGEVSIARDLGKASADADYSADLFSMLQYKSHKTIPSLNLSNHMQFNLFADQLRSDAKNLETNLQTLVASLSYEELKKIACSTKFDFRGYDREIMFKLLNAVKLAIQQQKLPEKKSLLDRLDALIHFMHTDIIQVDESAKKYLDGGVVNTVYEIEYIDAKGNPKVGVFKVEVNTLSSKNVYQAQFFGTVAYAGISEEVDAHLHSRAVASSIVDRLLYGNNCISAKTQFAIVNGQRGILMEKASGSIPEIGAIRAFTQHLKEMPDFFQAFVAQKTKTSQPLTQDNLKFLALQLNAREVKIDGEQVTVFMAAIKPFEQKNLATIAEGLLKLQIKDFITGECDRHPQNYLVDPDGKITGIDEDCCFGVDAVTEDIEFRKQNTIGPFVIPHNGSFMLRMPTVMTEELKNVVNSLYKNQALLKESLEAYISKEEIAATLRRLKMLHAHINSAKCLTVKDKNALLDAEAWQRTDINNSYFKREWHVFTKPEKAEDM